MRGRAEGTVCRVVGFVLVCVAGCLIESGPAAAFDEELLPAAVARLAGQVGEATGAEATWRRALREGRADVRAAAARAIGVSAARGLVPDLLSALSSEADPVAAAETARALVSLGDPSVDSAVLEAVRRVGGDLPLIVGDALGRRRGRAGLGSLRALRGADSEGWGRRALVRAATRNGRDGLTAAAVAALQEMDAVAWDEVLTIAREQRPLDPGPVTASLSAPVPTVRAATYWHLAADTTPARPLSEAIEQELAATPEAAGTGADLDARFGFEVLGRARGSKPREDAEWLARLTGGEPSYLPRRPASSLRGLLTSAEWSAAEAWLLVGGLEETITLTTQRARGVPDPRAAALLRSDAHVHFGGTFPPGYATGLMDLTGCRPGADDWIAAEMTYGRDGRPRHVGLPKSLPKGCEEVVRVLALSSLAPPGHFEGESSPETLLLRLSREPLSCLEAESPGGAPSRLMVPLPRARLRVTEPKKLRDVKARYPAQAREAGIEGQVEIEGLLGRTGCVSYLSSLRGPAILAMSLVQAASQWRYSPVLLDGSPVVTPLKATLLVKLQ